MEVIEEKPKGVQIQVKGQVSSKSFTVHGWDVNEIFERILFLFRKLEESEESVTIVHYKDGKNKTT